MFCLLHCSHGFFVKRICFVEDEPKVRDRKVHVQVLREKDSSTSEESCNDFAGQTQVRCLEAPAEAAPCQESDSRNLRKQHKAWVEIDAMSHLTNAKGTQDVAVLSRENFTEFCVCQVDCSLVTRWSGRRTQKRDVRDWVCARVLKLSGLAGVLLTFSQAEE
eukprot:CAMPEP_0202097398 /NCGR_PEP_ID=MMETSP0965-20130614/1163_1 /ASSEMBLY_ACC=CAM_ASM_000507 /TAXON_ID=4773 /ORGANISM="Schizochytrium aggregatum, Strain ATCC28209" /LENGTH=161 /DNA_ID=CAMNT_0048665765 /DNA_START=1079 /DNA_END=1561 /DNA_ORIENTATION=+